MYGKIFETELDSSIVEEPIPTRLLWHYLIVLADRDGNVDMTNPALARRVNIPLAQVEEALDRLAEPDPSSRSPEEGGRRILPIPGQPFGWHLVNYQKYRKLARYEDRLLQNREAQRRHREKSEATKSAAVSGRKKSVSPAEVDTEVGTDAKAVKSARRPPEADDGFEQFWSAYPRKVSKADAQKAWKQTARERPSLPDLLARLAEQEGAADWRGNGARYCPYPATWLRAKRWEDDPGELRKNGTGAGISRQLPIGVDERRMDRYRRKFDGSR